MGEQLKIKPPIGVLGGTFNPIHEGHIAIADHVLRTCRLSHIDFIPCFQPPHRDHNIASAADRLNMVKLAVKDHPQFSVNDYEIQQEKISYTVNTVMHLHEQNPTQPICLILGGDAFSHFHQWHQWEKIIAHAHLIVVTRTGIENASDTLIKKHQTNNVTDLHQSLSGKIFFDNINPIGISATQIRQDIRAGKKSIAGLNPKVYDYIVKKKIYSQ